MAGPLPVVGIAPIFTNALWRCAHQAHIIIFLIGVQQKLVICKAAIHFAFVSGAVAKEQISLQLSVEWYLPEGLKIPGAG